MEKNFVFSNFGIAPHSATPVFGDLLKTANSKNGEKHYFSNFGIAPHSAMPDFSKICWKQQKQQTWRSTCFLSFGIPHKAPPLCLGYLLNMPQVARMVKHLVLCHLGQRHIVPPFFLGNLLKTAKAANMQKNTLPFGTRMKPQGMRQDKKKTKRQHSDSTIHARTAIGILGGISCCACPTATSIGGFEFLGCWFVALLQLLPAQIFLSTAVDSSVLMIQSWWTDLKQTNFAKHVPYSPYIWWKSLKRPWQIPLFFMFFLKRKNIRKSCFLLFLEHTWNLKKRKKGSYFTKLPNSKNQSFSLFSWKPFIFEVPNRNPPSQA